MLKDITLGQYFPGKSPVHLLDPRTKLLILVGYIVALFTAVNWVSYGLNFQDPCKVYFPRYEATDFHFGIYRYFKHFLYDWRECCNKSVENHNLLGGYPTSSFYDAPDLDAHYSYIPADLYHISHCIDRWLGIFDEAFKKAASACA